MGEDRRIAPSVPLLPTPPEVLAGSVFCCDALLVVGVATIVVVMAVGGATGAAS